MTQTGFFCDTQSGRTFCRKKLPGGQTFRDWETPYLYAQEALVLCLSPQVGQQPDDGAHKGAHGVRQPVKYEVDEVEHLRSQRRALLQARRSTPSVLED